MNHNLFFMWNFYHLIENGSIASHLTFCEISGREDEGVHDRLIV